MANEFQIKISAVDQATATIRKINASMDKMLEPVRKSQASIAAFKKEISDNAAVKGLYKVGDAAKEVTQKVRGLLTPMTALVAVGSLGGIGALATQWGRVGFEMAKAASSIGISTSQLQSLRGAAEMAGVSTGELDAGLKAIGDNLEGGMFGRNADAANLMGSFGIGIHRLKDGAVDTEKGLMDVSRAIQGKNVEVQRLIANTFGVGALLPLLQKGPAAIAEFQKKCEELGGVMNGPALTAATRFQEEMVYLHMAIHGLENRISAKLLPVLTPLIEQFTNWIATISDKKIEAFSNWVESIANWLKQLKFDDAISGLKEFGIAMAALLSVSLLASLASFATSVAAIGGLVALSSPILAVAAAVAALVVACTGMAMAAKAIDKSSDTDPHGHPGMSHRNVRGKPGGVWERDMTVDQSHYGQIWKPLRGQTGVWVDANGKPVAPNQPTAELNDLVKKLQAAPAISAVPATPLGIRSNNPLNMMPGGSEAIYGTSEAGIAAAVANLEKNYSGLTLAQMVNKWSPPTVKGNSFEKNANYIRGLSNETGIAPDQVPDLTNLSLVTRLVRAQIKQENGMQPYDDAVIVAGIAKGMGLSGLGGPSNPSMGVSSLVRSQLPTAQAPKHEITIKFVNPPAGVSASVKDGNGSSVPASIVYPMQFI